MKIHCQGRTEMSQKNNVFLVFHFNYLYITPNSVMRHFRILMAFLKNLIASVHARGCHVFKKYAGQRVLANYKS